MSGFVTKLVVEHLDGRVWIVHGGFSYLVGSEASGWRIHVPAGFETDFASIPRCLWWLYPPTGKWAKPAVIHDWLYRTPGAASRWIADAVFYDGMIAAGVPWWRASLMWLAVRLFGWWAYRGGR